MNKLLNPPTGLRASIRVIHCLLLWWVFLATSVFHGLCAPGELDASFGSGSSPDGAVNVTVIQPDGRILIGGGFTNIGGVARTYVARLNSDGTLDPTFNSPAGASPPVGSLLPQPDGKILVAGGGALLSGPGLAGIARLNPDGSTDQTFDPGTGVYGWNRVIASVALQPNGQILAGGNFTRFNGHWRDSLVRLNPDGSVDDGCRRIARLFPARMPRSEFGYPASRRPAFAGFSTGSMRPVLRMRLSP